MIKKSKLEIDQTTWCIERSLDHWSTTSFTIDLKYNKNKYCKINLIQIMYNKVNVFGQFLLI